MVEIFSLSKRLEYSILEGYISEEKLKKLQVPLDKLLYTANFRILESKLRSESRSDFGSAHTIVIGGPQRSLSSSDYSIETYKVKANRRSERIPEFNAIKEVEFEGRTNIQNGDHIRVLIEGFHEREPGVAFSPDKSSVNTTYYVPRNLGSQVSALRIERLNPKTGKLVKIYETERLDDILEAIRDQKRPKRDMFEDY